jgi:hypothetical protein
LFLRWLTLTSCSANSLQTAHRFWSQMLARMWNPRPTTGQVSMEIGLWRVRRISGQVCVVTDFFGYSGKWKLFAGNSDFYSIMAS